MSFKPPINFYNDGFAAGYHLSLMPPDKEKNLPLRWVAKNSEGKEEAYFAGPWLPLAWNMYVRAERTQNLELARSILEWLPSELRYLYAAGRCNILCGRPYEKGKRPIAGVSPFAQLKFLSNLPKYLRQLIKKLDEKKKRDQREERYQWLRSQS